MLAVLFAKLFEDSSEFTSRRGKLVIHTSGQTAEFLSGDESVGEQLAETFVEHLGGNARDVSFQFAGAFYAGPDCDNDARTPFTADHIFQAVIVRAFTDGKRFSLHARK